MGIAPKMVGAAAGPWEHKVNVWNVAIADQWIVLNVGLSVERRRRTATLARKKYEKAWKEIFKLR